MLALFLPVLIGATLPGSASAADVPACLRILPAMIISTAAQPVVEQDKDTPAEKADSTRPWPALARELAELVRKNFFDAAKAGEWTKKHEGFGESIRDAAEFSRTANRLLEELGASHTRYYTPADPGYCPLRSIFAETLELDSVECESIGADVAEDGRVRRVLAGGPAARAKLMRGDRLVTTDGRPFTNASFAGHACETLRLQVERGSQEVTEVALEVQRIDPRKEWLTAQTQGSRLFSRDGRTVGYVPMFSCAGEEYAEALQEAFTRDFAEAEALIIDFRDGWGGCNPGFVNLFSKTPAELWFYDREGHCTNMDRQWRRPVAFVINGGTRSGKEIVAYSVKKQGIGKLVGERTAGAVLGGRVFPLSDGSILYLAVTDARVDGERLEGVGVKPDVDVPDEPDYLGHDPQLDAALDLLFSQLADSKPPKLECIGHHH